MLYTQTQAANPNEILQTSWNNYKNAMIDPDGAVRRRDQGNDVVSEGIAYTMLRAVWINDQETFDKVYGFAEKKMSRLNNSSLGDNLLAWLYQGNNVTDWGAASDADEDYALALAFAEKKWGKPKSGNLPDYREKSIAVQKDILRLETGWAGDKVYLQPGTWYAFKAPIPVNPSYLAPGHYKIFNQMSPDPRWEKLIESSYDILWKSSGSIDGQIGIGLPADWVNVQANGSITKAPNLGIDYKYDAIRTSMRVAMDYAWFNDMRAKNYLTLSGARNFLLNTINNKGKIGTEYQHDGTPIGGEYTNAASYGTNIGWFMPENSDKVQQFLGIMQDEYHKNGNKFMAGTNYYMENLAWMGYALGTGNMPNIYGGQTNAGGNPTIMAAIATPERNTPNPTIVATVTPSVTPSPSVQPTATPGSQQPSTGQWLQISNPNDNQNLNGKFTMKIKNNLPNNQGTWWSVDSGGWVGMQNVGNNEWAGEIDISGWNWKSDQNYTLHGWTKDQNGNQIHTQVNIHKQ